MPSLRELKKRLRSINTTEQLAGAMKTVAAAKFSGINAVLDGYKAYADSCRELMNRFGEALSGVIRCANPDAPDCYVVFASNRGLCGGYNIELLAYADEILKKCERPSVLISCGKMAAAHYEGKSSREFIFPDIPDYDSCLELCEFLRTSYMNGEISSVNLIYQSFINMLNQNPSSHRLLPMSASEVTAEPLDDITLYVPDKETVLKSVCLNCIDSTVFSIMLESAAGAQAATLMAMRSAYDNAQESSEKLETVISRKRQSEVTAGVIETASDNRDNN